MPLFDYTGQLQSGATFQGTLEAESQQHADATLADMGVRVRSLRRAKRTSYVAPLSLDDFLFFNEQIAAMTNAGVPLQDGLRQLGADVGSGKLKRLLLELADDLTAGTRLEQALARYVDETRKHSMIDMDFQYSSLAGQERLASPTEVTLYRIAQEAITNIVRHSNAEQASVVVLQGQDEITLIVEDDGCGFNISAVPSDTRLGLTGMRERATLLGGVFDLESTPGKGTTIRLRIPLNGAEPCPSES